MIPSYMIDLTSGIELPSAELSADLETAARAALQRAGAPDGASLTIAVTGDDVVQQLNRDYRGQDKPTDVLSFPDGAALPAGGVYLGDVVISLAQAERQAQRGGHALTAELQLLVVHGVLHLLGHDHADPDEKAAMWAAQADVLRALNASITGPSEE